jgi:hypothetical protein
LPPGAAAGAGDGDPDCRDVGQYVFGSSDAIAAVSIMMRDVYTLVTGHMPRRKGDSLCRWMLAFVIAWR